MRIAVVGGGITGLAAAHRLIELSSPREPPLHLSLLEASPRLGGVIATLSHDGFLIEEGPDSILTDKPWARRLAERVGLAAQMIGTNPQHRRSFVVRKGRLEAVPEGFYLMTPTRFAPMLASKLFTPLGKMRMALEMAIPRRSPPDDESVADFVTRRFGREALERIAQPMLAGIYGSDPESLSLHATLPRFHQMEQEHGSVIRGMLAAARIQASGARYGTFVSFGGGLQVLVEALAARLPAQTVRAGVRVTRLRSAASGAWEVEAAGRQESFDGVILALRAHDAADLVRPYDRDLSESLSRIAYESAATVSVALRDQDVTHPMDGFGFVVPSAEDLSILGCTFSHRKYPGRAPHGHALLRAFWGEGSLGLEDEELVDRTLDDLRRLLGLRSSPLLAHIARWPRSMPRYAVGHLDRVKEIESRLKARHPGLALAGNAYRGLGIPDCVRSGEDAAEQIIRQIAPGSSSGPPPACRGISARSPSA